MENFNYKILIFSFVLFLIFCLNAFSKSNIWIIDAAEEELPEVVKLLISKNVNLNDVNNNKRTALMRASSKGYANMEKYL